MQYSINHISNYLRTLKVFYFIFIPLFITAQDIDSLLKDRTPVFLQTKKSDFSEIIPPVNKENPLLQKFNIKGIGYKQMITTKYEYLNSKFLPDDINGHYSRNAIQNTLQVGSLPLSLSLNFDVHNNQVLFHYNIISININKDLIQNQLNQLQQNYLAGFRNYSSEMQGKILAMKDSLMQKEKLESYMRDSSYYEKAKIYRDKYESILDSSKRGLIDSSVLSKYTDSLKAMNAIANQSANLGKYINSNQGILDSIKQNQEWIEKLKSNSNLSSVEGVPDQILQSVSKGKKLDFLSRIENVSIGKSNLQHGTIIINQQSLFGGNIELLVTKTFYAGAGVGMLNNSFNFLDYNNYKSSLQNKNVFAYAVAGIGAKNQSHLHFIFSSFNNFPNKSETSYNTYQTSLLSNSQLGMDYLQKVKEVLSVRGELSIAGASTTNRIASYNFLYQDSSGKKANLNLAAKLSLQSKIEKTKTNIFGGVSFTSPKYFSITNPFILQNTLNANLNFVQQLFKNKVNLMSTYIVQRLGLINNPNPQTQFVMRQSAITQISEVLSLQTDYSFTGIFANRNMISSIHQPTATLTARYAIGKKNSKAATSFATNLVLIETRNGDLNQTTNNSMQSLISQQFNINQKFQYTITGNLIIMDFNSPGNISYGASSTLSTTVFKRVRISNTERYIQNAPQMKIFSSDLTLSIGIYKQLHLDIQGLYTVNLHSSMVNKTQQIRASTGLSYQWGVSYENKKIKTQF
jgi:hypothetical protein